MPPGGGYRAGSIYADLSFRLDDTGAAKFETRMRTARREAAKPVTAKLEADYDPRGLEQYERALKEARARAQRRQDFKAELGADFHPGAFREYERALQNADRNTRQFNRSQSSLGGSLGSFNRNVLALANSFRVLRWPAIIAGAGSAAAALSAAAGAATALTAALAPLGGALAAVPAGLSAFAQGLGAIKLASSGVADAFKASEQASGGAAGAMKKQSAAAEAVRSAQQGVKTAHEGVRSAQMGLAASERSAKAAQESLTKSRADATRQLEDMRRAVKRTSLDEESAVLAVREAREALNLAIRDPETSGLDIERAQLAVRQARQDLVDVRAEGANLRRENAKAQAGGVEKMPEVVDARRGLVDANRQVAESSRDVRLAQRDVAEAMRDVRLAQKDAAEAMSQGSAGVNKFADEMAKLPPAAQRFVRFLIGLKDEFQGLRAVTAQGLFPGVEKGITSAMRNLPILQRGLGRTAEAFGDLAAKAGEMVGSKGFGRDLETQMSRNERWIRRGGDTALNFAEALRDITLAAGPLVNWMTRYAEKLSETTEKQADAARKSGAMARFFEETRLTIDRLLRITADLAGALKNIGTIAYETLGKRLLGDLTKSADKFREWTASARGKNDIREYFEAITPAVYAFARLVEDVTKAFFRLGDNPTLGPMMDQIRTEALPALETLIDKLTTTLGPAMVGVITEFAQVLANLSEEGGALAAFISGFERILELIKFITDEVPFIGTVLGTLAAAGGIYKALQVGATITGLRTIGRMIAGGGIAGALKGIGRGVAGGGAAGGAGGGFMDMFKGRGDTPAKPLYVAVVGSMPGGGAPGGIAKTIGAGAFRTFLTSVAMPAAPIVFAAAATWFIAKYGPNRDLPTRGKEAGDRAEAGAPSSGRARQRSALSRNIEDLKPLENVPALNNMADALDRLAGTGKGGRAPQVKALGDRMRDALREGNREKISDTADALDKLAGNKDDSTSKTLRRLADEARKLGGLGTDMSQVRRQLGLTRNAFSRMSADGKTSMAELRGAVAENTRRIKARLDEDSEAGRKSLAQNFREARKSVRELMRDGVVSTRNGMKQIRELMAQEMKATYGITIAQARAYQRSSSGDYRGSDNPNPGGGHQRGGRVKQFAAGGWLGGSKSLVGPDNIQISPTAVAAPGEYYAKGPDGRAAVLNRHQAPVVDAMLQAHGQSLDTIPGHASLPLIERALGGPRALDGLFNMIQRPHMFARGGIVPVPGFPGESANRSVVGKIVAIAKRFGLTLTDAFGSGHESPGHTVTGTAADFSGGDRNMDAAVKYLVRQGYLVGYDGRFGSENWEDHGPSTKTPNFHLHVELGGRTGGPVTADTFRKIAAPRIRGGGLVGQAAQAGLRMTTAAANRMMTKVEESLFAEEAGGGGRPANAGQVRSWLAAGLRLAGQRASAANINTLFGRVMQESGGDPRAQNNWDSNARAGTPSKGLLQTIDPTFNAYKVKGHNNIWNPVHNVAAAVRYMLARYGRLVGRSGSGYQEGGRLLGFKSGGRSYPLGKRGKVIGTPHSGTHTLGNWQSDNALDIRVPLNTPVLAVADGTVNKLRGSYQGGASRFDGYQVTLGSDIGGVFYTHLSRALVTTGENVDAGEMIGRSGAANGVPHLHIGLERGNARRILSAAIGAGDDDGKDGKGGKGKKKKGSGMTFAEARAIVNKPTALMRQVDSVQRFLDWMGGDRAQPWKPPARALRLASGGRDSFYGSGAGEFHVQKEASEAITRRANRVGTSRDPKLTGAQKVVRTGVIAYDNIMQDISNLNQRYSIEERKYGQSDEVLIDPTTGQVNQVMVTKRADELQALIEIRERIVDKIEKAQDMARQVVKGLKTIITRLTRSLKHAPNKDRKNIRRTIAAAQDQLAVFTGNIQELGYQLENAQLDVSDLVQERAAVLGTQAEVRTPEVSADTQAQIAQAEERARVATERAEISERSLSVLGSPAGMNSQGIGLESGGAQIVINTLHPADPATLSAIATASNKGNWYGGNVQSSRVVTGV